MSMSQADATNRLLAAPDAHSGAANSIPFPERVPSWALPEEATHTKQFVIRILSRLTDEPWQSSVEKIFAEAEDPRQRMAAMTARSRGEVELYCAMCCQSDVKVD